MTSTTLAEQSDLATIICNDLWREILLRDGLWPTVLKHTHVPGLFAHDLIDRLELPVESACHDNQVVTLIQNTDKGINFDRHIGKKFYTIYQSRPSTQMYENLEKVSDW